MFVRIIGSAMGMAAVLYCMKKVLPFNLITLVFMVAVGVLFYGVILFLSGEIREEVKAMISLTKNRKGN